MKDFVVYHNPDVMGVEADTVEGLAIVTNKKVGDVRGSRIWLLTGQGLPRTFCLRSWFFVDEVDSGSEDGFETRLSGTIGQVFDPMVVLNDEEWFNDFKQSQGNFAFGFQPITENRFIEGLQKVAGT